MKKFIYLSFAILILSGCSSSTDTDPGKNEGFFANKSPKTVTINNHVWTVETATTPEEQAQGLSNRESLPADNAMYFIFNDVTDRTFYMKNMKFPLDIVWIKDDEIIKVDYDAMPEGENPLNFFYSKEAVNRVLEINNGDAMKYDLKPGDKVLYNE